jgi:hypothetical protein
VDHGQTWTDKDFSAHRGAKEKQCKPVNLNVPTPKKILPSKSLDGIVYFKQTRLQVLGSRHQILRLDPLMTVQ